MELAQVEKPIPDEILMTKETLLFAASIFTGVALISAEAQAADRAVSPSLVQQGIFLQRLSEELASGPLSAEFKELAMRHARSEDRLSLSRTLNK